MELIKKLSGVTINVHASTLNFGRGALRS